jgi:5-formyltetrahydrofolate cyclo-ligase
VQDSKKQVRKQIKTRLERLSEKEHVEYASDIANQLFSLREWKQAKVIGITISIPPEIPTPPIIQRAWREGKKVAVPKCDPADKTMKFKQITSFNQLESVYSGLLEPIAQTKKVDAAELDLVIVPGLGFTKEGYRIGFGGGYYDRFLSQYKGNTVALAYDCQLVDELPIDMHDIPVQQVVTSTHVFQTYTQ